MTRKDFVLLAEAIESASRRAAAAGSRDARLGVAMAASSLSWALADTNPFFDRRRFLDACGVEE